MFKMLTWKPLLCLSTVIIFLSIVYLTTFLSKHRNDTFNSIIWTNLSLQQQVSLRIKILSTSTNQSTYTVPRVVVSLTSFSSRLKYIDGTLQSLFRQTYPPDQIYLSIPIEKYARYKLPPLSRTTIIDINQKYEGKKFTIIESVDYGPSTKLLGVLHKEQSPETIIITVDDDTIYHPQVLEYLVTKMFTLTTNSSVAVVCETVFKKKQKWHWAATNLQNSFCKNAYLAAYAGAAYRRKYFDETIFDYKHVPQGCILHDDVYISGYLYRKGIYPYITSPMPRINDDPWSVIQHKKPTKLTVGNSKDLHKKQLDCIQHFNYFQ